MSGVGESAPSGGGVVSEPAAPGDDGIRPLAPADLPAAAALLERTLGAGSSRAGLERLLRGVAFEDPWHDPQVASLALTEDDGTLVGLMLGSARRYRLDGEPVRALCGSNVVVDPSARGGARGMALIERVLEGPQAFSYTDGSPQRARRLLQRMGFSLLQLESLEWTSVLRPTAYWQGRVLTAAGRERFARAGRWAAHTLDHALHRTPLAPALGAHGLRHEPLTPELMVEHLDAFTRWARLRPDYDVAYLRWLLGQLADDHPQGRLVAQLVRRDGKAIGWHVSLVPAGGVAQVMQVVARPRDAPDVLSSLLAHAREAGALAARGRLEAPLADAITERRTVLRRTSFALVKSEDAAVAEAIRDGAALFSRLDGDWWIDPRGR